MHLSLWIGWAFLACDAARAELLLPSTTTIAAFLFGSLTGVYPQYTYVDGYTTDGYTTDGYTTDDYTTDDYTTDDYTPDDYITDDYTTDDYTPGDYTTDGYTTDDYTTDHYTTDDYTTDADDASCSTDKECPEDRCCHPDSNKCGRTSEYCHDVDGEKQCCPTLPDGDYGDCYADSICEEAETPWYEHPGFIATATIVGFIASVLGIYAFIRNDCSWKCIGIDR